MAPKLKYPGPMSIEEANAIENLLAVHGFVLLWSELLEDYIAFFDDDREIEGLIPDRYVRYSRRELEEMASEEMSDSERRLVHVAKKEGGIVAARGLITKIAPRLFE